MRRIKESDLERVIDRINELTGSPAEPWTVNKSGKYLANIGNYHLDGAYGGWTMHRMVNTGGGVTVPISTGYVPKRELYDQLQAFVLGLDVTKEED